MSDSGDDANGDGDESRRTPGEVRGASLRAAFVAAALFVSLVIAGWGITSLVLDDDVVQPGMPLWAGPTSLLVSSLVTLRVGYTSTRDVLTAQRPRYDFAPPVIGGFGTVIVHLAVLALFAAANQGTTDVTPLHIVLRQITDVFGIVVLTASIIALFAVQVAVVQTARRDSGSGDGMRE